MLNKAIIDLRILRSNAKLIRKNLNKSTLFNAVVKADAYGHGAEIVANALNDIVDSFSVALVEEGVRLRLGGITKDILCFSSCNNEDIEIAIRFNLTLTVTNKKQVILIEQYSKKQFKKTKVHVKFNTGMNRQGVDGIQNLEELLQVINRCDNVVLDKWICKDYSRIS